MKKVLLGLALSALVFSSCEKNIENIKGCTNEIKVDTIRVIDTIRITDTVEIEIIKKVYIKQKASRDVDYVYIVSKRYDVSEAFKMSRQYASEGNIPLAKKYLKKGKDIKKETDEYKSHIIYVD